MLETMAVLAGMSPMTVKKIVRGWLQRNRERRGPTNAIARSGLHLSAVGQGLAGTEVDEVGGITVVD